MPLTSGSSWQRAETYLVGLFKQMISFEYVLINNTLHFFYFLHKSSFRPGGIRQHYECGDQCSEGCINLFQPLPASMGSLQLSNC